MQTLTVTTTDDFDLAVQVAGPEDGPVLLLLAGQANNHHWWDGVRAGFEDRWRTVSLDQRGTGDSRGPVTEWSTRTFAADAAAVLEHLGTGPAAVYGTSMGGRVAQVLAAEHPHSVGRLVLACTSPGGPHALERDTDVRRRLSDPDPAKRRASLRELFYSDAWAHRPEESRLFGDRHMNAEETRAHLRVSSKHDAWDLLPRIEAPTLVLHGTEDRMVPTANAPLLAKRIPGAELGLHEGGRHGFFEEFATQVTPLVRRFLE